MVRRVLIIGAGMTVMSLLTAFVMTSSLCHARFFMHGFENGQCAASDTPFDVFAAFATLGALMGAAGAGVWLIAVALVAKGKRHA